MRREGSAFSGVGTVTMKELADNLTSTRMRLLELLIFVTGAGAAYSTIGVVKDQLSEYPFVFLLVFTYGHDPLPSFVAFLGFLIPIVAIALGFDAVNSEFNRRTMSRILAQPIYRDALLIGKFFAGLITLAVVLSALWLLVVGLGILLLGLPPNTDEVLRGFAVCFAGFADVVFAAGAVATGALVVVVIVVVVVVATVEVEAAVCGCGPSAQAATVTASRRTGATLRTLAIVPSQVLSTLVQGKR